LTHSVTIFPPWWSPPGKGIWAHGAELFRLFEILGAVLQLSNNMTCVLCRLLLSHEATSACFARLATGRPLHHTPGPHGHRRYGRHHVVHPGTSALATHHRHDHASVSSLFREKRLTRVEGKVRMNHLAQALLVVDANLKCSSPTSINLKLCGDTISCNQGVQATIR
jgi:hypothetical protein